MTRLMRWKKHPKDYNHGRRGWIGGNRRYDRTRIGKGGWGARKNRTMGRA